MAQAKLSANLDYKFPFCYILIGPAGCGKSHVREKLLAHPTLQDAAVISTDDLVRRISEENWRTYRDVFDEINNTEFKAYLNRAITEAVLKDQSIVVDRCNLTKKTRSMILRHLPSHYNVVMVLMDWDNDKVLESIRWNPKHAEMDIPRDHIIHMFKVFNYPTEDEYDQLVIEPAVYV